MTIQEPVATRIQRKSGTVDTNRQALFPLRLTPFEFFFLCDDRAAYRGIIPIEVSAQGKLDEGALEKAFAIAQVRHPLLSARVENDQKGWPSWSVGEPQRVVFERGADAPIQSDAQSTAGVQLCVRVEDTHVRLLFAFRHVAVDGLGAFQFISDLFAAYAHFCKGGIDPPSWRPLEPERLRDRDRHQLFRHKLKLVDAWRMLRVHLPLSVRPAALVSEQKPSVASDCLVPSLPTDFLVETLNEDETAALSRVAAQCAVMLNDLLLRDFFMMLAAWNCRTSQERGPLRVMIPTNMRRREDARMPAANVFSYAFITRYGSACRNRKQLLKSISDDMAKIKRDKLGLYYEAGLRLFCRFPGFVRWSVNRKWAFATAVFTNLGSAFDHLPLPSKDRHKFAGDLILETGAGAGPIRPDTRISFSAHSYAGRLSIGARCDPRCFTPSQQRALLASYVEQLRTTIHLQS
jgi:NRPS condensation-like uncharacterized protein